MRCSQSSCDERLMVLSDWCFFSNSLTARRDPAPSRDLLTSEPRLSISPARTSHPVTSANNLLATPPLLGTSLPAAVRENHSQGDSAPSTGYRTSFNRSSFDQTVDSPTPTSLRLPPPAGTDVHLAVHNHGPLAPSTLHRITHHPPLQPTMSQATKTRAPTHKPTNGYMPSYQAPSEPQPLPAPTVENKIDVPSTLEITTMADLVERIQGMHSKYFPVDSNTFFR